jgi:heptosyltransferase-2
VLIVKIAAIGDVVMALPMVTAIRRGDVDARITWMVGRTAAPLLRAIKGIDAIVVVDDRAVLTGTRAEKMRAVYAAWRALGTWSFDDVYVAHRDPRYALLALPVRGARHRFGAAAGRRGIPGRSMSDDYARLVSQCDDYRMQRPSPPAWHSALPRDLDCRLQVFAAGRSLVALAPGGARNVARDNPLRRWPVERYAKLARELDAHGFAVIVIGDATDKWVVGAFDGIPVLDLVGETSLDALLPLFARCAAVVTHDSGPLHIARLSGTRVVALFGPTLPSAFMRAEEDCAVLWPGAALTCTPCYDGTNFASCGDNRCMQMITMHDVLAQVERLAATQSTS